MSRKYKYCKYIDYGLCTRKSGYFGGCHISIGCDKVDKDGDPQAYLQVKCKDYKPEEE